MKAEKYSRRWKSEFFREQQERPMTGGTPREVLSAQRGERKTTDRRGRNGEKGCLRMAAFK